MFPGLKAIPAFNGAGSTGSGGGGSLSFTLAASATSTSSTITIPAQAIAGDFAVLIDAAYRSGVSVPSAVTPGGWITAASSGITDFSSAAIRLMSSYRILTAGMGGTTITGMNSSEESKTLLLFRPSTSIITSVASVWNTEATTGNPALQTVSATGITAPLIVVAAALASVATSVAFSTETPAMTNITNPTSRMGVRIGYTIYNTSPADQAIDTADNGTNALQSGYVRFT